MCVGSVRLDSGFRGFGLLLLVGKGVKVTRLEFKTSNRFGAASE